jgi:PAS domain S-box-containing protein
MEKARILIVEDEAIIAKDLQKRLEGQGYSVPSIVASGEKAVEKAEKIRPDLILMDIVLPGEVDGIEIAARIRSNFDIPVIYLTAYADDNMLERAKKTEPFGYIIKPFEDKDLRSSIEMGLYKHRMDKKLRQSNEFLNNLLESLTHPFYVIDANDYTVKMANSAANFGPLTEESTCYKLTHNVDKPCDGAEHPCTIKEIKMTGRPATLEHVHQGNNDRTRYYEVHGYPVFDSDGNIVQVMEYNLDITERKESEEALKESEQKLRIHAKELEESNTALKVLLKQRENDKRELEESILSNIKQLILPYTEKLKRNKSMSEDVAYLNIIESNLEEIVSPFSLKLSSKYLGFTPREIMIADLIKDGKQDKDIMEMLNISYETVKSHRQNIRKKLGIYSKRVNLRTYLLSLSE